MVFWIMFPEKGIIIWVHFIYIYTFNKLSIYQRVNNIIQSVLDDPF